MSQAQKTLSIFIMLTLMLFTFAIPVHAFEGREGNKVVIGANEVIDDDLYVGANDVYPVEFFISKTYFGTGY